MASTYYTYTLARTTPTGTAATSLSASSSDSPVVLTSTTTAGASSEDTYINLLTCRQVSPVLVSGVYYLQAVDGGGVTWYIGSTSGYTTIDDANTAITAQLLPQALDVASMDASTAQNINTGTNTQAAIGDAIDAHLGGDSTRLLAAAPLTLIDPWPDFFANGQNVWVANQATSALTAGAAAAIGATTVTLTDASTVMAGVSLVTAPNAATWQNMRVTAINGNVVTLAAPLTQPIANGQRIDTLWQNEAHLSTSSGAYGGMLALARFIADRTPASATKITVLGNSWVAFMQGNSGASYDCLTAAYAITHPNAIVVKAGVGGNRTDQMLARFDTDVPADSTHVVMLEWVNDTYQGIPSATQAEQWEALVAKVRAIGAAPVIVGPPPLSAYPAASTAQHTWASSKMTPFFPRVGESVAAAVSYTRRSNLTNIGTGGNGVLGLVSTGTQNIAYGDGALAALTTGSQNTALGMSALAANAVSNYNTALGYNAGASATGGSNTFIGTEAGHLPNGVAANATTSGAGQTAIGYRSGKGGTGTALYSTAIGYNTTALGDGSFAIGASATGIGASANGTNLGVIGTGAHTVSVPGFLRIDRYQIGVGAAGSAPAPPAQPSVYLLVKTMVGGVETQYVVPAYQAS